MFKKVIMKMLCAGVVLVLFTGCGAPQSPSEQPGATGQSGTTEQSNTADQSNTTEQSNAAGQTNTTEQANIANSSDSTQENAENPSDSYITEAEAKAAALSNAGFTEEEVQFAHVKLESDDGKWKYDVEFHKDNMEYDYDIDALTGEVLDFDHDAEHRQSGTDNMAEGGQITEERAKQIALEHAGADEKDTQNLTIELDYDDGRAEYEIEWYVGQTEYSCDVDAGTGEILSFEKKPA